MYPEDNSWLQAWLPKQRLRWSWDIDR